MDKSFWTGFFLGVVLPVVLTLVLTLIFEDFARHWKRRTIRRLRWIRSRFQPGNSGSEYFQIGKLKANWIVLEGSGNYPYRDGDIEGQLEPTPLKLPPDLQRIRNKVEAEQNKIKSERGNSIYYNGPMVALVRFSRGRTASVEDALLHLRLKRTDYYTFLATSMSLNEPLPRPRGASITVRDKYLSKKDYGEPVPELATSLAVNLAVVTKDNYIIISKRGERGISGYPGAYTVPVNECVNPDKDARSNKIDFFETAKRGIEEELGLDKVTNEEIRFFSLGVDTDWYFYALTGVVRLTRFTRDDIKQRLSRGPKDKWEHQELIYDIQFKPDRVVEALRGFGVPVRWHPAAFVSVVQALINEYGQRDVERAFGRM